MLWNVCLVVFVLLMILQLKRVLQLAPLLGDSLFRTRGSSTLENSVRYGHDRNNLALTLFIPAVLVTVRYQLYRPFFLKTLSPDWYLIAVAGAYSAFMLLRMIMFWWLKPRRRYDNYVLAHQAGHTYFIVLMVLMLATVGLLTLFHCPDMVFRVVIYVEIGLVYLLFIFRKTQILSLFCNPLRTFLYLCGLEFFPAALLIVSAAL
jgi:hypothetical protein